jgi:hypothetical protein
MPLSNFLGVLATSEHELESVTVCLHFLCALTAAYRQRLSFLMYTVIL